MKTTKTFIILVIHIWACVTCQEDENVAIPFLSHLHLARAKALHDLAIAKAKLHGIPNLLLQVNPDYIEVSSFNNESVESGDPNYRNIASYDDLKEFEKQIPHTISNYTLSLKDYFVDSSEDKRLEGHGTFPTGDFRHQHKDYIPKQLENRTKIVETNKDINESILKAQTQDVTDFGTKTSSQISPPFESKEFKDSLIGIEGNESVDKTSPHFTTIGNTTAENDSNSNQELHLPSKVSSPKVTENKAQSRVPGESLPITADTNLRTDKKLTNLQTFKGEQTVGDKSMLYKGDVLSKDYPSYLSRPFESLNDRKSLIKVNLTEFEKKIPYSMTSVHTHAYQNDYKKPNENKYTIVYKNPKLYNNFKNTDFGDEHVKFYPEYAPEYAKDNTKISETHKDLSESILKKHNQNLTDLGTTASLQKSAFLKSKDSVFRKFPTENEEEKVIDKTSLRFKIDSNLAGKNHNNSKQMLQSSYEVGVPKMIVQEITQQNYREELPPIITNLSSDTKSRFNEDQTTRHKNIFYNDDAFLTNYPMYRNDFVDLAPVDKHKIVPKPLDPHIFEEVLEDSTHQAHTTKISKDNLNFQGYTSRTSQNEELRNGEPLHFDLEITPKQERLQPVHNSAVGQDASIQSYSRLNDDSVFSRNGNHNTHLSVNESSLRHRWQNASKSDSASSNAEDLWDTSELSKVKQVKEETSQNLDVGRLIDSTYLNSQQQKPFQTTTEEVHSTIHVFLTNYPMHRNDFVDLAPVDKHKIVSKPLDPHIFEEVLGDSTHQAHTTKISKDNLNFQGFTSLTSQNEELRDGEPLHFDLEITPKQERLQPVQNSALGQDASIQSYSRLNDDSVFSRNGNHNTHLSVNESSLRHRWQNASKSDSASSNAEDLWDTSELSKVKQVKEETSQNLDVGRLIDSTYLNSQQQKPFQTTTEEVHSTIQNQDSFSAITSKELNIQPEAFISKTTNSNVSNLPNLPFSYFATQSKIHQIDKVKASPDEYTKNMTDNLSNLEHGIPNTNVSVHNTSKVAFTHIADEFGNLMNRDLLETTTEQPHSTISDRQYFSDVTSGKPNIHSKENTTDNLTNIEAAIPKTTNNNALIFPNSSFDSTHIPNIDLFDNLTDEDLLPLLTASQNATNDPLDRSTTSSQPENKSAIIPLKLQISDLGNHNGGATRNKMKSSNQGFSFSEINRNAEMFHAKEHHLKNNSQHLKHPIMFQESDQSSNQGFLFGRNNANDEKYEINEHYLKNNLQHLKPSKILQEPSYFNNQGFSFSEKDTKDEKFEIKEHQPKNNVQHPKDPIAFQELNHSDNQDFSFSESNTKDEKFHTKKQYPKNNSQHLKDPIMFQEPDQSSNQGFLLGRNSANDEKYETKEHYLKNNLQHLKASKILQEPSYFNNQDFSFSENNTKDEKFEIKEHQPKNNVQHPKDSIAFQESNHSDNQDFSFNENNTKDEKFHTKEHHPKNNSQHLKDPIIFQEPDQSSNQGFLFGRNNANDEKYETKEHYLKNNLQHLKASKILQEPSYFNNQGFSFSENNTKDEKFEIKEHQPKNNVQHLKDPIAFQEPNHSDNQDFSFSENNTKDEKFHTKEHHPKNNSQHLKDPIMFQEPDQSGNQGFLFGRNNTNDEKYETKEHYLKNNLQHLKVSKISQEPSYFNNQGFSFSENNTKNEKFEIKEHQPKNNVQHLKDPIAFQEPSHSDNQDFSFSENNTKDEKFHTKEHHPKNNSQHLKDPIMFQEPDQSGNQGFLFGGNNANDEKYETKEHYLKNNLQHLKASKILQEPSYFNNQGFSFSENNTEDEKFEIKEHQPKNNVQHPKDPIAFQEPNHSDNQDFSFSESNTKDEKFHTKEHHPKNNSQHLKDSQEQEHSDNQDFSFNESNTKDEKFHTKEHHPKNNSQHLKDAQEQEHFDNQDFSFSESNTKDEKFHTKEHHPKNNSQHLKDSQEQEHSDNQDFSFSENNGKNEKFETKEHHPKNNSQHLKDSIMFQEPDRYGNQDSLFSEQNTNNEKFETKGHHPMDNSQHLKDSIIFQKQTRQQVPKNEFQSGHINTKNVNTEEEFTHPDDQRPTDMQRTTNYKIHSQNQNFDNRRFKDNQSWRQSNSELLFSPHLKDAVPPLTVSISQPRLHKTSSKYAVGPNDRSYEETFSRLKHYIQLMRTQNEQDARNHHEYANAKSKLRESEVPRTATELENPEMVRSYLLHFPRDPSYFGERFRREIRSRKNKKVVENKKRHPLPLISLLLDPKAKLDVPRTIKNFGTVTKNSLEDEKAPVQHVKGMISSARNAVLATMRIPPEDMIIPSKYKIIDRDVLKEKTPIESRQGDIVSKSSPNANDGMNQVFQRVGSMMRQSVESGQAALQHFSDIAHNARNVFSSTRKSIPKLFFPYIKVPEIIKEENPKKVTVITPRFADIGEETSNSEDDEYLKVGKIMDALGLSHPTDEKIGTMKFVIRPKNKQPVLQSRFGETTKEEDPGQYVISNRLEGKKLDESEVTEILEIFHTIKAVSGATTLRELLSSMKDHLQTHSETSTAAPLDETENLVEATWKIAKDLTEPILGVLPERNCTSMEENPTTKSKSRQRRTLSKKRYQEIEDAEFAKFLLGYEIVSSINPAVYRAYFHQPLKIDRTKDVNLKLVQNEIKHANLLIVPPVVSATAQKNVEDEKENDKVGVHFDEMNNA